jgi:ribosomal protein S18 acetylase RimI-like enzyme
MTDGRPTPPRRPETARPRQDPKHEENAPPSAEELDAIERQQAALQAQAGADVVDDPDLGVVWIHVNDRTPALSFAKCVRWPANEAGDRLRALAERMRSASDWPQVSIAEGATQPPDMQPRLTAAGWVRVAGEQIMFTRHPPIVPHLDPGLRVEAVTRASVLDCVRLETENFGLPPGSLAERAARLAAAIEAGGVRGFLLRLVREPIASTRLTAGSGVAALSAVGVAPRHRRRGYGRMITAVATRAGLVTGHKLVWLSVDPENVAAIELYRSLGYEPALSWSRWAESAGR